MRAINLVPADSRPSRYSGGKSGGAAFAVLGGLGVATLAASVFALSVADEKQAASELTTIQDSTSAYQRVASEYASFEAAAKQADQRITTVRSLAQARFDWAGALRDLSRLIPDSTRISGLSASVDATSGQTSGGSSSTLRTALPVPAVAISGCTLSQKSAALLVTQLQAMRRVTNVTLESSKKATDAGSSEDSFQDTKCTDYEFSLVIFFAPGNAKSSAEAVPQAGATPVSTEAAGGTAPTTPGASAEGGS